MQDTAPLAEGLVGREDHRAPTQVTAVDDVVEHVGSVGAVGEVVHLVDHEHVRVGVGEQGLVQAPLLARGVEGFDQLGGRGEERFEAVLDGAVGDRDREMGLATSSRCCQRSWMAVLPELRCASSTPLSTSSWERR